MNAVILILLAGITFTLSGCSAPPQGTDTSRLLQRRVRAIAAELSAAPRRWTPQSERAFETAARLATRKEEHRLAGLLALGTTREAARAPGALDTALFAQPLRNLVLDMGPGEAADPDEAPIQWLQAGLVLDVPWLRALSNQLHGCEAALLPRHLRARHAMTHRVVIAKATQHGGTITAPLEFSRFPRSPARRARLGAVTVVWQQALHDRSFVTAVEPAARSVLSEAHARDVTFRAYRAWFASRWLAHQLGERTPAPATEESDAAAIAYADVMAARMLLWLVAEGHQPTAFAREVVATMIAAAHARIEETRTVGSRAAELILHGLSKSLLSNRDPRRVNWEDADVASSLEALAVDLLQRRNG